MKYVLEATYGPIEMRVLTRKRFTIQFPCWLVLAWFMWAWSCTAEAAPRPVVLLLSDASAPYQEVARAIRDGLDAELAAGKATLKVLVEGDPGLDEALARPDTLLIPLGLKAAQSSVRRDNPILSGFVARASFEKLFAASNATPWRRAASAIYLDQPLSRRLELIHAIQPRAHTVGAVFGSSASTTQSELNASASAAGLRMLATSLGSGDELFNVLKELLPNVDVLLLLPDPLVVNRNSIQNLMLSTYRQRIPAVGYSRDLVDAGALAAVFSTPQQIGAQIAETVQRMLPGKVWELPAPAYPKYFTVKINPSVARALDIAVPSEAALTQRMGGAGL